MEDKDRAKKTFYFKVKLMKSSRAYLYFIHNIRTYLHFSIPENKYFYINMVARSGEAVTIIFRQRDLYLIGYEVKSKIFELKETHTQKEPTISGAELVDLTMDYYGLLSNSHAYLGGFECMDKCIQNLRAEDFSKQPVAKSLLTLIISFPEAIRFQPIYLHVGQQFNSNVFETPVPGWIHTLNKWGKLSELMDKYFGRSHDTIVVELRPDEIEVFSPGETNGRFITTLGGIISVVAFPRSSKAGKRYEKGESSGTK